MYKLVGKGKVCGEKYEETMLAKNDYDTKYILRLRYMCWKQMGKDYTAECNWFSNVATVNGPDTDATLKAKEV